MWQSTDYRDKYGPMLYLLNSEQDYEYLATKAGYREEIAHDYHDVQRRLLRAYLLDLEADINELREAAAPVALGNAVIARSVEHNLRMFNSVSQLKPTAANEAEAPVKRIAEIRQKRRHIFHTLL